MSGNPAPVRPLPPINEMNRYFWCGGSDGILRILRCNACGNFIHPYAARCDRCRSPELAPHPVSGRGKVVGFTINVQPWYPDIPTPYVIALVELEEQSNIRLVTNLPTCPIEAVRIGLAVRVYFEKHGELAIPLFEPDA